MSDHRPRISAATFPPDYESAIAEIEDLRCPPEVSSSDSDDSVSSDSDDSDSSSPDSSKSSDRNLDLGAKNLTRSSRGLRSGSGSTPLHTFPPACFFFLQLLPGNDKCMDCGVFFPKYANTTFGVLICRRCRDVHAKLAHRKLCDSPISLEAKKWTCSRVLSVLLGGNDQYYDFLKDMQQTQASSAEGKYIGKIPQSYASNLKSRVGSMASNGIPSNILDNRTSFIPESETPDLSQSAAELEELSRPSQAMFSRASTSDEIPSDLLFPSRLSFPPSCLFFLRVQPGNDKCVDCGDGSPQFANVTFGVLLCMTCSDVHRTTSSKASIIKTLWTDLWTLPNVLVMMEGGNNNFLAYLKQMQRKKFVLRRKDTVNASEFYEERYESKAAKSYQEELSYHLTEVAASYKCFIPKNFLHEETDKSN